jgi:capsular exopolysaccharide synthesis family protein
MGRTYEALKKAEAEKERGANPPIQKVPIDRQEQPEIQWDMGVSTRVEYQKIRAWLANPGARGQRVQTVMVVACRAGQGTTTTAALLASTLAEGEKHRALIVDGNLRTPTLNRAFHVRNNGGFAEAVSREVPWEAQIQSTNRPNLFVLTSGQIPTCPAELLEGEATDQFISQLKHKFNFTIFDAAPLLEFPDAYALASKVDGVILVVEAEKTSVEDAQRAKRRVEEAGARILGVVLNRQKDYTPVFLRRFFNPSS